MSYKLVQFVEDRIFEVCATQNIKSNNCHGTVLARYRGYFYQAIILNEGTKAEMMDWKKKYVQHEKIMKQYFRFIPTRSNNSYCDYQESTDSISTQTEVTENVSKSTSTQTDDESSIPTSSSNSYGDYLERTHSITTQTEDAENSSKCISTQTDELSTRVEENPRRIAASSDEGCDFSPTTSDTDFVMSENTNSCAEDDLSDSSIINEDSYSNNKLLSITTKINNRNEVSCSNYESPNTTETIAINDASCSKPPTLEMDETTPNIPENVKRLAIPISIDTTKQKTKFYFCIFCKSKVMRFARHLFTKHKTEKEIMTISNLPKKNPMRMSAITTIRSRGTFEYNTDAKFNKGDIIVARRPHIDKNRKVTDYVPCPKCKNFYKNNLLFRHYRRCGNVKSAPRKLQAYSKAILLEGTTNNNWLTKEILPGMQKDHILQVVRDDDLILNYGYYLCMRHDGEKHLTNMIRQKLRCIADFLLNLRKIDPTTSSLESVFHPSKFNKFLQVVRICAGYNDNDGTYRAPSLPNVIGPLLKDCADRLLASYIKNENQQNSPAVERWLELYRIEYPLISKNARKVLIRRKWNKPRLLPLTEDILKLNSYLQNKFTKSMKILKNGFDKVSWNELSKCTLLLILVFNRKRVGELEKLLIQDFNKRHNIQANSESYKSLKRSEQIFSKRYMHIEIRGKLGRPVCLMINHEQVEAIDIIIKYREEANVNCNNPYVFGRGDDKFFEGARSLRDAASICGATQPNLLRGTKLRKHIATVSQALNLTENELAILADYMGHDIQVHRQFYRLPNEAIHLAKISQLLFALDNDTIHNYKGKTLEEINVEDLSITEVDDNEPDSITQNDNEKVDDLNTDAYAVNELNDVIQYDVDEIIGLEDSPDIDSVSYHNKKLKTNDFSSNKISLNTNQNSILIERTPTKNLDKAAHSNDPTNKSEWTPTRKRTNAPKRTWTTPEKYAMRNFFASHLKGKYLPSSAECRQAIHIFSALRGRTFMQIKLWVSNILKKQKNDGKRKLNFE